MSLRRQRIVAFAAKTVAAWTMAVFVIMELVRPNAAELGALMQVSLVPSDALGWRVARASVAGTTAGLLASFLELKVLPRHARRFAPGRMLLIRTVTYACVTGLTVLITIRFVARRELQVPLSEFFASEAFQLFVRSGDLLQFVVASVVASFVISAAFQISRLLGPGTARQILLGRYVRPVEEDRLFMFVDLAGSTALAERLGAARFADFKNDFFHDLAEPALDTRAQIVQYVGDEVLLTWLTTKHDAPTAAVRFFFLLKDRVSSNAGTYQRAYGAVPRFRAGLHGGPVVVSQLGDVKREIVFSGDTVNTAARIQGQCRELGEDFLASEAVARRAHLPPAVNAAPIGSVRLRGKAAAIDLVRLRSGQDDPTGASMEGVQWP